MTLENCFYTIIDVMGDTTHLHLCETHPVYEGHFPGQPICPGVFTMSMVRECASRLIGRRLRWKEVKSCRFTGMLYPGDDTTLVLNMHADADDVELHAEISKISAEGQAAVMLTIKGTLI